MAADSIKNAIRKLEEAFVPDVDFLLDDNIGHAFETLCNCLKEIISTPESYSSDQKHQLVAQLKQFQINMFRELLLWFSPSIPASVLSNLFNTILYQIQIEMVINESINDIYFDASLNCLITDVTIDYLFEVRQSTLIDEYFLRMLCTIGSWAMWNRLKRSHSTSVKWKNQPTFFQLNNETDRLLRGILTYINRHFRENPMSNVQVAVFTWAQSIMDVIPFVPFFVKTGYPEATLEWLSIEPNETMISLRSWRESLDFVHNLARHESGVKALNQLGAISILKAWKGRYLSESTLSNDENYEDLRVVYYMSYALLLEPALLKRENSMDLQVALDHILDRAVQAFQSTSLHYGPYHVSEFWTALARFTVNDECLLYMLIREDMFEFSMQKFLEYNKLLLLDVNSESSDLDTLMCSLLYTIFWSISFQTNYHVKLKTNTEFVGFIQQTAKKNSNDGYVGSIRQSANGILFNLDLIQQSHLPSKPDIDDHIDGVKVMISYSHKDSAFCRRLVNTLKDQVQGDLWVDFIKLEPPYEDDWEEIAEAISNCDVVAMIVTADYCSSKSCRREVIHSDKRNKPMIPIYQGSEYEPDDWFEIRAGSATWVRFGSMNSDEEVMQTLVKLINSHKKTKNRSDVAIVSQKPYLENNHTVPPIMILTQTSDILSSPLPDPVPLLPLPTSNLTTSSLVTTPRKPIEQWTSEEVHQWLCLPPSILQFSSGRALLAYARLIPDEDAERDEYERSLKKRGLTREQWANLICSLKTLRLLHIMETSSKALPEQWSSDEVKCWFEQNKLSNYLIDTFAFVDGMELVIYAKMMTTALVRIDSEYDRLRTRIQARYNGQDLLQLDEYVRLVRALKKIVEQSQL